MSFSEEELETNNRTHRTFLIYHVPACIIASNSSLLISSLSPPNPHKREKKKRNLIRSKEIYLMISTKVLMIPSVEKFGKLPAGPLIGNCLIRLPFVSV